MTGDCWDDPGPAAVGDCWERRMAERAAARSAAWSGAHRADREPDPWSVADRQGRAAAADLTLAEAVVLLDPTYPRIVCACVGPPWCCRYRFDQARAVRRAAHIAVRMMADLAARRAAAESPAPAPARPGSPPPGTSAPA